MQDKMLKCRTILQNQGQLVSLLCTQQKSHLIKFVYLINHKLQLHIQHYGSLRPSKCIKNKTLGRARDPRANGAWLSKLTERNMKCLS